MKCCIVFSSCTGNTRKVAEAIAQGTNIPCFPVQNAPAPQAYDMLALGFWVRKGLPDTRSRRYMARVYGKHVFLFGTLGAWPHSEHALHCLAATRALLEDGGNTILDAFLCQGRVNPRVVAATQHKGTHPLSIERIHRLHEAARHPTTEDCATARHRWQQALQSVQMHTAVFL